MAIWPFFRHRKRSRKQAEEETGPETVRDSFLERSGSDGPNPSLRPQVSSASVGKAFRGNSKRRKRNNAQTQPNSSHRQMTDSINLSSPPQNTALSGISAQHSKNSASPPKPVVLLKHASTTHIPHSQYDSLAPARAPTLYARRRSTDANLLRSRSEKRKRDDRAREQAIRNTGAPLTVLRRPATFTPGQLPGDFRQRPRIVSGQADTRDSDFSLPLQPPDRIVLSDITESYAFKLSAFGALTPRPLLRYAEPPADPLSRDGGPSKNSFRKGKKPVIRDDGLNHKNKIKELADDLDAGALRELMERHHRRKEIKRQEDQERLRRKLQERADRQQEEERRRFTLTEQGTGDDGIQERIAQDGKQLGTAGERSTLDLEPDPMEVAEGSRSGSWLRDASKESLEHIPTEPPMNGLETRAVDDSTYSQGVGIAISTDLPVANTPSTSAVGRGRGSASGSQLPGVAQEPTPDVPQPSESEIRFSDTVGKTSSAWTSFFRRSGSRLTKSPTDRPRPLSEFSKTSKESLSRSVLPPDPGPPPPIPERSFLRTGAVPRSQSKFIEHLNDFPMPPARSQLPSQDVPTTIKNRSPSPNRMSIGTGVGTAERYSTSMRSTVATPETGREDRRSSGANSPEPRPESGFIAQSLASIDSEGSWLSGKPVRRSSQARASQTRGSVGSKEKLDNYADSTERADMAGDEYYNKPVVGHDQDLVRSSGIPRASSSIMSPDNDSDDDVPPIFAHDMGELENEPRTLHASVEKRTVLVHQQPGLRSKEALLQDYQADESEPATPGGGDSPIDGDGISEIHRATSVDLGKGHVRRISAGSARLLNLPRRPSDAKRMSSGSTGSGVAPSEPFTEENQL